MTKGPLATFLGGLEIHAKLSSEQLTDPLNYYNVAILILLPVLWGLLNIFKKIRFKDEVDYVQNLQRVMLGGRTNIIKRIIIIGQFIFCAIFFAGHFWASWSLKNKTDKDDPNQTALRANIFIGFMMTICCCYPVLGNRGMRLLLLIHKMSPEYQRVSWVIPGGLPPPPIGQAF